MTQTAAPWGRLAAASIAVLGAVIAVVELPLHQFLAVASAEVAVLVWVLVWLWPSWKGPALVYAAALSAASAAVAAYTAWGPGLRLGDAAASQGSSSVVTAAQHLTFIPIHTPIPYCAAFSGTGRIPAQDTLLVFDEAANANGDAVAHAALNYDGAASSTASGSWSISGILIGYPHSSGQYVEMTALLVPSSTAAFVDSIPDVEGTGLSPSVLGLGAVASRMTVERGTDSSPCG